MLLGSQEETRKLIVSTQEATVSTELSDKVIQKLDFDILKKTQKVSYTGTGYFVVDLDGLTKECIFQDNEKKVIIIKIGHAYLQAIEIDPDNIIVDEVKKGLFTWGNIELTVKDLGTIVSFSIKDYGKGIPANHLEDLFNGSSYTPSQTADGHKGMGIGLSICKTIITAHHGSLTGHNHKAGAEFIFTLPKRSL